MATCYIQDNYLTSFSLFNDLPKEIRLAIWEFAIPEPRIVYLQKRRLPYYCTTRIWSNKSIDEFGNNGVPTFFDSEHSTSRVPVFFDSEHSMSRGDAAFDYGPTTTWYGFRSPCTPPALLFACRESYGVASARYTKAFGSQNAMPQTWFDFARDTLYLGWDEYEPHPEIELDDFNISDTVKVHYLANFDSVDVSWSGWKRGKIYSDYEDWLCDVFLTFPRLEKFTVVLGRLHEEEDVENLVFKPHSTEDLPQFEYDLPRNPDTDLNMSMARYQNFILLGKPVVDLDRLEEYRYRCSEDGFDELVIPPVIDCQIVTTSQLKSVLDAQEIAFRQEIGFASTSG